MPSADGEIVVAGNLFPRDSTTTLFEQTSGYDAFLRLEVSTRAVVVTVSTGSGLSTDQATQLDELHKLQGLDASNPMTVTPTSREAGSISQTISGDGSTTSTVTRV